MRLRTAHEAMSSTNTKNANIDSFIASIEVIRINYEELWSYKINKCYENQTFHLFGRKRSVLRNTINSFQGDGDPIVVAYGDGNFSSTGKSEESVPVKAVKDMCKQVYKTVEVSDWMTSSVCIVCAEQLLPVYQVVDERFFLIRGMKWCDSEKCRHRPIKHREDVGAHNIYTQYQADHENGVLPDLLNRNLQRPDKVDTKKIIVNQRRFTAKSKVPLTIKKKGIYKRLRNVEGDMPKSVQLEKESNCMTEILFITFCLPKIKMHFSTTSSQCPLPLPTELITRYNNCYPHTTVAFVFVHIIITVLFLAAIAFVCINITIFVLVGRILFGIR